MRRKKLAVCVLSAALMIGAAAITSYAAEGWQQSGSSWIYVDSNGNKVTNTWKKGADNLWRYLDSQGNIASNCWVDDEYFVESTGIMASDKWLKLPKRNLSWNESSSDTVWYYFTSSGKMISDGWSKINGKYYYFDSDGVMQTGWVDDDTYYTNADGSMQIGWAYLEDPDDDDDDDVTPGDDEDHHWYYFQSSGKKYVPSTGSGDYKQYKIDGTYYCFDSKGAMQTGWVNMGTSSSAGFENYRYYQSNGKVQTGWLSVTPPEDDDYNLDLGSDVQWYYFSSSGEPKVGPKSSDASTNDLVRINNITYLFNEKGNPVYGLRRLEIGSSGEYACYFFGADKATSSVVKGKGKVTEGDGTVSQFYFTDTGNKAGRGYTGVEDGYLYYMGKLQMADSGTKYEVIKVNGKNYLVTTGGKIVKSGTVKNADGVKFKTNSNGCVAQVDGVNDDGSGEARSPVEPTYWED